MTRKKWSYTGGWTINNLPDMPRQHIILTGSAAPNMLNNPPPGILRKRRTAGFATQGEITSTEAGAPIVPPVPDVIAMYAGVLAGTQDFGVRTLSPKTVSSNFWCGRWDLQGTGSWVAQIYPASIADYNVAYAVGVGTKTLCTFQMTPNNGGTSARTYTIENGDGTVGTTLDTQGNGIVSGLNRDEFGLACYDQDGNLEWATNLYWSAAFQRSNRVQFDTCWVVPPLSPTDLPNTIRVVGAIIRRSTETDVGSDTYSFGATNTETYVLNRRWGYYWSYTIDLATGNKIANSLMLCGYTSAPRAENLFQYQLSSRGLWRGGQFSLSPFLSLGFSGDPATHTFSPDLNVTATNFSHPTTTSYHDSSISLLNDDRTIEWAYIVGYDGTAGTGNNIVSKQIILADGGVFALGVNNVSTAGTTHFRDATTADITGPTRTHQGEGFFFKYDSAGNFQYVKEIELNAADSFGFYGDTLFQMSNGNVIMMHRIQDNSTATWGQGETNEESFAFTNGTWNSAVVAVDHSTGEIQWVQPIRLTLSSSRAICYDAWEDPDTGELVVALHLQGNCIIDPNNTADTITLGSTGTGEYLLRYAADGTYNGKTEMLTTTTSNATVLSGYGGGQF